MADTCVPAKLAPIGTAVFPPTSPRWLTAQHRALPPLQAYTRALPTKSLGTDSKGFKFLPLSCALWIVIEACVAFGHRSYTIHTPFTSILVTATWRKVPNASDAEVRADQPRVLSVPQRQSRLVADTPSRLR